MLVSLGLKNFKRHEELHVEFRRGIQLLKGANEAGKSSLSEAIVYALFGARALPLTLADTVTWGKPESSLRVDLEFTHAGQTFKVYRQKSGAELTGVGVTASGQAEVTRFVENLLGVSADVAGKMMLAKQNDLRGALAAGPAASISLIEGLADFEMLDSIIEKIQATLPSGSPLPLSAMLQQELLKVAPLKPALYELETARQIAEGKMNAILGEIASQKAAQDALDVAAATTVLASQRVLADRIGRNTLTLQRDKDSLDRMPTVAMPDVDVDALKELQAKQRRDAETVRAFTLFTNESAAAAKTPSRWAGDISTLTGELKAQKLLRVQAANSLSDARQILGQLEGTLVKAGECAFCGKVLDYVPEVIARNKETSEKILEMKLRIEGFIRDRDMATENDANLTEVLTAHNRQEQMLSSIAQHIRITQTDLPRTYAWDGPVVSSVDKTNYDAKITEAMIQQAAAVTAGNLRMKRKAEIDALATSIMVDEAALEKLNTGAAAAVVDQARELTTRIETLRTTAERHRTNRDAAAGQIATMNAQYEAQQRAYEESLVRRTELTTTIDQMILHNGVIKKIREARPEVARRLWSVVLHAVSHYFSKIRGTPCVVTRGDAGFLVDGHPAAALSGSTLDSLGLAIRIALTKTFLPNMRFLSLDEPAAASDAERETNMLGTIASSDFDQILMISHSDLADAFATDIIQL